MIILPEPFLRTAFFLLYNHLAFTYDWVAWAVSLGQWTAWRRTVKPYLEPGQTLELASGTGGLFLELTQAGLNPIGLDLSPFMARLTAARLAKHGLPKLIVQAKAQALPFPNQTFTNIIATFPTNYIFEAQTLTEVYRILQSRPERLGKLIIVLQGQLEAPQYVQQIIHWLYQLTGQRTAAEIDLLAPFRAAGFQPRWEIGQPPQGKTTLLIAQKPF